MQSKTSRADRSSAVMLVIDIQERLAAAMARREQVTARSRLLMHVARITGVPIIVTRQYPQGLGDIEGPLRSWVQAQASGGAVVHEVDKMSFDCFAESSFSNLVGSVGRRQLIVCGMETHICVTQTALSGLDRGFDVQVAADACSSREQECHRLALDRMSAAGVTRTTVESVAYELVGRAGTPEFKELLAAVKAG